MARYPYFQPLDLNSGEIVELDVDEAGVVYLMTAENLNRYCAGKNDFTAEGSMPGLNPVELVAGRGGRWYLVSEHPLEGMFRLRRGLEVRAGLLQMQHRRPREL